MTTDKPTTIASANRYGVYPEQYRIRIAGGKRVSAGINLALTEEGWRAAIRFDSPNSSFLGPICNLDSTWPSREDAIGDAVSRLIGRVPLEEKKLIKALQAISAGHVQPDVEALEPPKSADDEIAERAGRMPYSKAEQADIALPPRKTPRGVGAQVHYLAVSEIAPDPRQPRKQFDAEALQNLADSIREHGVVQPIVVRPAIRPTDYAYVIIAGERRWRAAQLASLSEIPAVIRTDLSGDEVALVQVLENIQRENLSTAEMVASIGLLVDRLGLSETSRQLGKDKSWVSRIETVRDLWEPARKLIEEGLLASVEIAHDLAQLANLDESNAQTWVGYFYSPRAWSPSAPTRAEIRSALETKRSQIKQRQAQEEAERQRQIAIDNQRGHGSTAGDDRDEDDPPESAPQESPQERAEREASTKAASDNRELFKAAVDVSEKLAHFGRAALGIAERPAPENDCEPICSYLGRDISDDLRTLHTPVEVDLENCALIRIAGNAERLQDVRYNLQIELPQLSEQEVLSFFARFGDSLATAPIASNSPSERQDRLVQQFLAEFCEKAEASSIKVSWLHEQFAAWFGCEPLTIQHFGNCMKRLGYSTKRSNGLHYLGIAPQGEAQS